MQQWHHWHGVFTLENPTFMPKMVIFICRLPSRYLLSANLPSRYLPFAVLPTANDIYNMQAWPRLYCQIANKQCCYLRVRLCYRLFIPCLLFLFRFFLMVAHVNRTVSEVLYELDHRSSISLLKKVKKKHYYVVTQGLIMCSL